MLKVTLAGEASTATFEYTASAAKITTTLDECAQELYERMTKPGGPAYGTLTNAQKLALVDVYVRGLLITMARDRHVKSAKYAASISANSEADTLYF